MAYIDEIKYFKNGKVETVTPAYFEGRRVVQWENTLGILANCLRGFPRCEHIDSAISYIKEQLDDAPEDEGWNDTLQMLLKAKEEGREHCVLIDYQDEDNQYSDHHMWIRAKDGEDAYRQRVLQGGYDAELIYIKEIDGSYIFGGEQ